MKQAKLAAALLAGLVLSSCVAPVGPVEVTRFHDPALRSALAQGTITVAPAPGEDPESLELRSYMLAVGHELQKLGYSTVPGSDSQQVAEVKLERSAYQPERERGPVSVGVGGATGSRGSGLGLGIGIDLSGKPKEQITTQLAVTIRERASGKPIWEGRAEFTVRADSPMAETPLGAARLAEALFSGFPGNNGETIEVK